MSQIDESNSSTDDILQMLGLSPIAPFSVRGFLSDVFSKHDPNAVESHFSVGTPMTTPTLSIDMGNLPSPWIFARSFIGVSIVYLLFHVAWNSFQNPILLPGLIIVGSFAIPFSVLILFFELNTPKNVSMFQVVQLVFIGGAFSILLSLVLFDSTDLSQTFGDSAAGIVEEIGKLFAVLLILRYLPDEELNCRLNALLYGAAVGAGFAAFESAGYAFLFLHLYGDSAMVDVIFLRGILSPFCHIIWTAMASVAYWDARKLAPDFWQTISSKRFLKLFSVPVILHFCWNIPFLSALVLPHIALGIAGWIVIISMVQTGLKEVRAVAVERSATT